MNQRLLSVTTFILAVLPAAASAQEHEAVGLSPFSGNVGNALWTLVIFVLVVVILGKFAWGPILKMLQDREAFIHKSLADAKRDREDADARLKEYTGKLQAAHREMAEMMAQAQRDSQRLREEMKQKAKAEAETILTNAQRQIQLETARALQQIRHEAADMSVMIASKLLQRNLSKEDNAKLIEDALKQVETRKH
jgi:F-type H+-transporting ATPase subunit b